MKGRISPRLREILDNSPDPTAEIKQRRVPTSQAVTPENVEAYGWKQRGRRCRMCARAKLRRLSQSDTGDTSGSQDGDATGGHRGLDAVDGDDQ